VTPHDYWLYHYHFGKKTTFREKSIGNDMLNNLIINTLAPVLFAYGLYHNQESARERSLKWLEKTRAEKNSITRGFEQYGVENKCAFDSQALIELKNEYCSLKRCLECAVGHALLK
ncbi:MAG: DUF2851 family protein, partial [Chitinophagaceae bacterium]|nr:DUF2851 family protein [Chitinophagaceae bacterium]